MVSWKPGVLYMAAIQTVANCSHKISMKTFSLFNVIFRFRMNRSSRTAPSPRQSSSNASVIPAFSSSFARLITNAYLFPRLPRVAHTAHTLIILVMEFIPHLSAKQTLVYEPPNLVTLLVLPCSSCFRWH